VTSARPDRAVEIEVRIAASPETIFGFFTDHDKMIQWIGRDADLDPQPTGLFRCDVNGRDVARGEYVEVDPPNRIVFTWGWEQSEANLSPLPGESKVEVTFEEVADGTLVRLVHSNLPTDAARSAHGHGWDHYLSRLAVAVAGGDPGPDPWGTPDASDREFETEVGK
jgi:uncharacterized protein YndB with AHSA1/START domain